MGKRGPVSLESESQAAEVEVERRAFRSVAPAAELSGARLRVGRIPIDLCTSETRGLRSYHPAACSRCARAKGEIFNPIEVVRCSLYAIVNTHYETASHR